MSEVITTIVIAVVGSSALFSFLQFLIQRKDSTYVKSKDIEPINEALMAIMQERLESLMTKYLELGEITVTQFKALETMVAAYENIGGDGFIHELYEQTKDLIKNNIE